ncbi:hypothetical protein DEU56DRAFT_972441 [Suillus clintonianus]|uniref:uncharacterized protein n=1 Tax=Suillus clintonianus TaxID=1904413 RepID=UPI001B87B114|nr:uncharacterized protein DEU56DRAFT_972441 [Suillus clintonianus]KAG2139343.1 hypothetical protein DEU56DRAFT_972441 [Suillus clintonianus]
MGKGCKQRIWRYLDKGDAKLTSNMAKHAKSCWGPEAYDAAQETKSAAAACEGVIKNLLKSGTITSSFERTSKGKVTYSHRQHTKTETNNRGFQSLMKMGRPEYYLPSPSTVSRDVKLVFANVRQRITRMLQEYDGELNFTTDAWTSPNHKAFVAVSVHLEHQGKPLAMVLDVVEVAQVGVLD